MLCLVTTILLQILQDLKKHNISVYKFPDQELDESNRYMRTKLPFAVVGSEKEWEDEDGVRVRGREYPWGAVNIEDQVLLKP